MEEGKTLNNPFLLRLVLHIVNFHFLRRALAHLDVDEFNEKGEGDGEI
jgi:hypothetical protein